MLRLDQFGPKVQFQAWGPLEIRGACVVTDIDWRVGITVRHVLQKIRGAAGPDRVARPTSAAIVAPPRHALWKKAAGLGRRQLTLSLIFRPLRL